MSFLLTKVLLILFIKLTIVSSLNVIDLGGVWKLQDKYRVYKDVDAEIPGGIYTDLQKGGIIDDPFYGFNDVETRWVAQTGWNYSFNITVNQTILSNSHINLVFNGLDTFSTILINGIQVGTSNNMFVRYVFDVKPYLTNGNNSLEVQFKSPIDVANKKFEEQEKDYVVPPICVPEGYNGECHANHIRKMQASFSWDWGPALPSMGIWRPVYLEAFNSTVIRDVTVNTFHHAKENLWNVTVKTYFAKNSEKILQGTLVAKISMDSIDYEVIQKLNITEQNNELYTTLNITIPSADVELWWPNGYGTAKLYKLKVTFVSSDAKEQHTKRIRIGFRTVKLMQDTLDKGLAFYFKVNDVPIYAKGSNIIPVHILPEHGQKEATVRYLLQSAKDVHMNMLRVWGGGVYESDLFYDIADELGILIWQDFMFACSMYPASEEFLSTVKDEVIHQVKRLQHHASIALWAGNNENEAALRQDWYGTGNNFTLYKHDYVELYVYTIENLYRKYDNRPFLLSSPTNGDESYIEGHVAENPQSTFYGDVHFYNYMSDGWNANIYPLTRFASEYGYQSLPSIETLLTATDNVNDLHPDTKFMKHRQHHPLGYFAITQMIEKQMKLPNETSPNYYKAYVYYSQIYQAMAVKIETEFYRQWRSNFNSIGEGMTMGALYWQLNDVWVAPTWASIDFKNKWKMLHYFAKNFFEPVLVTGHLDASRQLDVYVVSDLLTPIYNATVNIRIYKWDSQQPVPNEFIIRTDILSGTSKRIQSIFVDEYLSKTDCGDLITGKENCFFYMTMEDDKNQPLGQPNFIFPTSLKTTTLQTTKVEITTFRTEDFKTFTLDITSDGIALFVWLYTEKIEGTFSENGFIQVDRIKKVQFVANETLEINDVSKNVKITHFLDSQYL